MPIQRCVVLCLLFMLRAWGGLTVTLPSASSGEPWLPEAAVPGVSYGSGVSGTNNVGSLLAIDDDQQQSRAFGAHTAYAAMQTTSWFRVNHGAWFLVAGNGKHESYAGNHDAGQLWIDLHADAPRTAAYAPEMTSKRLTASWVGVGRRQPFHWGSAEGVIEMTARGLYADSVLLRGIRGDVAGEDFTGMVKTIASGDGTTPGCGWALDAAVHGTLGARWHFQTRAEGLTGAMHWRRLDVADDYLVSPRIFEDPDGFIHDVSGISGANWTAAYTAHLRPRVSCDVYRRGRPAFLAGMTVEEGRTVPTIGLAADTRRGWTTYLQYAPTQHRLGIGLRTPHWRLTLTTDDLTFASPRHGAIVLSHAP